MFRAVVHVVTVFLNGVTQQHAQIVFAPRFIVGQDVFIDPTRLEPVIVCQRVLCLSRSNDVALGIVAGLFASVECADAIRVELISETCAELQPLH